MASLNNSTVDHFQHDIEDIKQSLRGVMETLQRLAVLEERFTMVIHSTNEIQKRLELQDERLRKLESEYIYAEASAKTIATSAKIAWAIGGGIAMTIISGIVKAFL